MESNNEGDRASEISESCWEPQHRTDSRKWLMRDCFYKLPRENASEMRVGYQMPTPDDRQYEGIRRVLHRDKTLEEIEKEIIKEDNTPVPVEKYCSEYDSNFHYAGYDPNTEKERNSDLFLKYPLYSSEPATVYKFMIEKQKGTVSIPGCTESKYPFKKNCKFTKELSGGSNF